MKSFNDYLKEAALSAKQKKIAAIAGDKEKIDADDLAALRAGKKPVEEASCSGNMKKEELVGKQHKLDKNHNGKLDAQDFKMLRKEETEELDEGKMKDIYTDMMDHATKKGYSSHKEFTPADYDTVGKQHGISGKELAIVAGHKTAQQADTHFKKPVQPGKEMDRARALAQRGMQSLSKEEVEAIEEKLTQIDELSKKTLGSYAHKAVDHTYDKAFDDDEIKNTRTKGIERASKKLGDKSISKDSKSMVRSFSGQHKAMYRGDETTRLHRDIAAHNQHRQAHDKITKASGVKPEWQKEEVSAEMSPYLKATLAVMDEGKIDNLRDTQALRAANKSAYDKDYKADDSHPHITLNKGTAYGGSNQKDDEGDEKPDNEKQEKRGRGRPSGSKSGARQKGAGKDNSIDGREYTLHLPK